MNALEFVKNTFYSLRQGAISAMNTDTRNYDWECGYPTDVSAEQYRKFYDRWGIATRAVQVWPEESWAVRPTILENEDQIETEFEKVVKDLNTKHSLFSMLNRIDVLSGIGRYGVLFMGLGDGRHMSRPATNKKTDLLYLRAFDESKAEITDTEKDITNKRYGYPTTYRVAMQGPDSTTATKVDIDWTRMVHIADNCETDEIYGVPRLQAVYNHVHDIRKIGGGSAEMFWKGGFPGLGITVDPQVDFENVTIDTQSMKDEIERYSEGLKRCLILTGATAKSLNPNVADPRGHFEVTLKLITIALGVPQRIFMGSEAAKLASIQDKRTWQSRVAKRQNLYLTPRIIRPVIDRFIEYGILPTPKDGYLVTWPDLEDPSESDQVKTALAHTNAIARYMQSGAYKLIAPEAYLRLICKMSDAEIATIKSEVGTWDLKPDEPVIGVPVAKEISTREQESSPQEDNNG